MIKVPEGVDPEEWRELYQEMHWGVMTDQGCLAKTATFQQACTVMYGFVCQASDNNFTLAAETLKMKSCIQNLGANSNPIFLPLVLKRANHIILALFSLRFYKSSNYLLLI